MRFHRFGSLLPLAAFSMALLPQSLDAMKITELLYNPGAGAGAGDSLEFVEIHNDSPGPVDISGAYFSKGINFVFPEGTFLHARGYIAVSAAADVLKARFPQANVIGDFSGKLDNGGESIALVTRTGAPLAEVTYKNQDRWPSTPDGTGYTLALRSPLMDPDDPVSWTRSAAPFGTPGVENFAPPYTADNEIFPEAGPEGAWRYRKGWNETTLVKEDFSVPPGAWRAPAFDDSSWVEAPVPIGFNEPEIVTLLADMAGNYDSFAVRKRFTLTADQIDEMTTLTLLLRFDDGCVVYLNGEELGRMGLAGDPGTDVPFDAQATTAREIKTTKPLAFVAQKEKVHVGENVLSVQVHNKPSTANSNDAGFAASLTYQTTVVPAPLPEPSIVFNEVVSRAAPNLRVVEIFNTRDAAIDIGSYILTDAPLGGRTYTIPPGTVLPARGFLSISEATVGFSIAKLELSLFLFEPNGTSIVDAITVEDPLVLPAESQSHARFPDGEGDWWVSREPTPGAPNHVTVEQDVVLNEIHFNPKLTTPSGEALPDQEQGEFIELFNRSGRTISLDGSRLSSGFNHDFAPGTTLGPGAYLVVARNPKFIREAYGLAPGQVVGLSETASQEEIELFGALKNRGERVRLVDSLGNTMDEVRYAGDGEWEELADGGGSTLELIDPRQDNSSPNAWGASDESQRAPWTEIAFDGKYVTNLVPQPMESELHIYLLSAGECLLDGISLTAGEPAVEHIPNGDFEVDTRPWRLTGTHVRSQRTTAESKVGAAALHMVATGSGDNRVNRIELDTTPALKVGDIHFRMWARWLKGANTLHVSGHNNAFGVTVRLPMPLGAGSPGRENGLTAKLRAETGSDNLGPVLSHVRHEPAVPGNLEPIQIRATVTDSDGVAAVEVLHQKDNALEFQRAPLFDDGAHDDGNAGDGEYAGEIPGYPVKTLVNFMIEARDAGGRVRAFPRLAPDRTLLFIVDDKMTSTVFRYRLLINAKNLNTPVTGLTRRLLHSDELVRGTFVFEESEVYYDIGLRYRGSPWNRPPDPKMFRIRFNSDKPFIDGVKHINISRYGSVQNEGTSYQLLQQAGTPDAPVPYSPRYQYLNMKLNLIPHGGALAEIRPIGSDYIRYNWPNDSDGYAWKVTGKLAFTDAGQMAGGGPDWTQLKNYMTGPYPGVQSPENYRYYFNNSVRDEDDAFEPLIRLLHVMDKSTTPDAEYDAKIADVMNVDASLRVFAVRSLLSDWDTVDIGNGQNAYIYYAPIEGRHYLVPWDMDHTFERSDVAMGPPGGTNGFKRLINRPMYKRMYAGILQELNESSWSDAYVTNWTNLVSETGGPARVAGGAGLVSFLRGRRNMVNTYIKSGVGVPFAVTTPSPVGFPSPTALIAGTAGLDVAFLYAIVNGGEAVSLEPAWSTPPRQTTAVPTIWQAQVPGIRQGKNSVEILAFTRAADFVDSKTIEVIDSTGWAPPAAVSIVPASGPLGGGTAVSISGTGFRDGASVLFGAVAATDVVRISDTELSARSPVGAQEAPVDLIVTNIDGQKSTLPGAFTYGPSIPTFRRGEVDGSGTVDLTDALFILAHLFQSGVMTCDDAADVDDNGSLNLSDVIVLLSHLFQGGAKPPEPFDQAGADPSEDTLGCGE